MPRRDERPDARVTEALVIGAGPAGLMAAEVLAESGVRVTVTELCPFGMVIGLLVLIE